MTAERIPPASPPEFAWLALQRVGLETLLRRGPVLVAVAQAYPTGVPDTVREAPYVLRIGHALTPPIALEIHDGGFKALLAFNGVAHEVHVPWAAVLAAKLDVGADVAPSSKSNHLKLVP